MPTTRYQFEKETLPAGQVYPITRRVLDVSLSGEAGALVKGVAFVRYTPQRGGIVVDAFTEVQQPGSLPQEGRVFVRVYAVPEETRAAVQTRMVIEGLPALQTWLRGYLRAGVTWRSFKHWFWLSYVDGKLQIDED